MPVEVMARRGQDTLCYGPLKPVGLPDPRTGVEPLRRGAAAQGQRRRQHLQHGGLSDPSDLGRSRSGCSHMIPGLEHAEFVRYGVMHRNTYLHSPEHAEPLLSGQERATALTFAGQMTGVEGYVESTASGLVAAVELARRLLGEAPIDFPRETALGALAHYVSDTTVVNFQPMNVNFGIIPPLGYKVKGKRNKNAALSQRALEALEAATHTTAD